MAKKIHKRKKDGRDDERKSYLRLNFQGHRYTPTFIPQHVCVHCDRVARIYGRTLYPGMSSDPCPYGEV